MAGCSENEPLHPIDQDLVHQARRGDPAAFHALVDRYGRMMYGLAYSLLGNAADAEDVVQETFAGAYKGLSRFEERASVKTWLSRILVNQVARLRRDRGPMRTAPMESADTQAAGGVERLGSSGIAGVDARLDVAAMLRTLSDEHREVIVLRELQQLSYEQIASVLNVPRGTVESRLHRARAELKKRLQSYLD